jgi:hypothetical protein
MTIEKLEEKEKRKYAFIVLRHVLMYGCTVRSGTLIVEGEGC